MQVLFCDLHSAVVLADNAWSSRQNYRPCVMVHRCCRPILLGNSTTLKKSRPTLSFVWHPLKFWAVQIFVGKFLFKKQTLKLETDHFREM